MPILFYPETNTGKEGSNKVEVSKGKLLGAGVALRGFYMSFGDNTDHWFRSLVAATINKEVESQNNTNYVKYDYRCNMKANKYEAKDTKISSLVIADLGN